PPVPFDGAGVDDEVRDAAAGQGPVQPEAVTAGLVTGKDRGIGWQSEALLGLGDLLVQPHQVAGGHRPEARLLGRRRAAGQQPLVLAEFQSDVQGPRRGHAAFSVFRDKGVLPDGDWYHLRYLAAYMVSNDKAQRPAHAGTIIMSRGTVARVAGPLQRRV